MFSEYAGVGSGSGVFSWTAGADVCDGRDEKDIYKQYDVITGRVADDRVMLVVDMYHAGIWDKERAIREMKIYPQYDQTAFISQTAIDRLLVYESAYEVTV